MKLVIGPKELCTEFEFYIFKKHGMFTTVHGRIANINKIGLYLSGGIDSAVLLCLIITELYHSGHQNIPIYCFTVNKDDNSSLYASTVINEVLEHYPIDITHVLVPNDHAAIQLGNIGSTAMEYVKEYANNMLVYMAINHPPDNIVTFKNRLHIKYTTIPHYTIPFLYLHKPQIIDN